MLFSDKSSQMNPILSGHCHQWPRVTPIIHDPKFAGKILHCPVSNKQYGIFHLDDCGQARRNHSDLDYCGPQALPMVRVLVKFCCIFAGLLLTTIPSWDTPWRWWWPNLVCSFSQFVIHTCIHDADCADDDDYSIIKVVHGSQVGGLFWLILYLHELNSYKYRILHLINLTHNISVISYCYPHSLQSGLLLPAIPKVGSVGVFSCPEQLNRWPCHWLTHWLTVLLLLRFKERP